MSHKHHCKCYKCYNVPSCGCGNNFNCGLEGNNSLIWILLLLCLR